MKKATLLAEMLTVPIVPAVAQPPDEASASGATQQDNSCPTERLLGQFVVFIVPEAPQEPPGTDTFPPENVVYAEPNFDDIPMPVQLLYYPEIAAIEDPCERLTAEEAKRAELGDIASEGTVLFNTPGYAPLVPSKYRRLRTTVALDSIWAYGTS
jgi:hypothetical protein